MSKEMLQRKGSKKKATTSKQRDIYLDVLKGFAILLVVFGHSVQTFTANGAFDDNIAFRIIYSFHMPLFMFLSGAAAAYSIKPMGGEFIKRKFLMLVVPFVAWIFASYFLGNAHHTVPIASYVHQAIVSPDYGLWFLWVLFLNFCLLAAAKPLTKRLGLLSYPLVWLLVSTVPTGQYGLGLVKWHLPFFFAGYLIFSYRQLLARFRLPVVILCLVVFPILVMGWHRVYYPSYISGLEPRLAAHHLATVAVGDAITVNSYQTVVLFYKYLVAFCGIGFVFALFQAKLAKRFYSVFAFLGLYTLDIYVLHEFFLRFGFGSSWVRIVSGFIIALGLSLVFTIFILRRFEWTSKIFLGGRAETLTIKFTGLIKKLTPPGLRRRLHQLLRSDYS